MHLSPRGVAILFLCFLFRNEVGLSRVIWIRIVKMSGGIAPSHLYQAFTFNLAFALTEGFIRNLCDIFPPNFHPKLFLSTHHHVQTFVHKTSADHAKRSVGETTSIQILGPGGKR